MTPKHMAVSICRKEGRSNYGSEGASCELTFEFSAEAMKSIDVRDAEIAKAYKICDQAVTDQLIAAAAASKADPALEPGEPRERAASTEYDRRRDDQDRRDDDRGRNDRNGSPPRRDDRDRFRDDGGGRRDNRGGGGYKKNWRETGDTPRTGSELWGYAKDWNEVKWFTQFGKDERFPEQFRDWDSRDVDDAMRAFKARRSATSNGNGRH